jgi:carboxymethylenebutenolidase
MGEMVQLTAADGHVFDAYAAGPAEARQGLVVVQEIFGVNGHMRHVSDDWAKLGFRVLCPAVFDRVERGAELSYSQEDGLKGRALRNAVPEDTLMLDIEATARALGTAGTGIVGYCWGGTIAWWGSTRTELFDAAVGWYGSGIAGTVDEPAHCPVQLHFAELDKAIPLADAHMIRDKRPDVELFVYDGVQHGFGCNDRPAVYDAAADALAKARTLDFFRRHLKG